MPLRRTHSSLGALGLLLILSGCEQPYPGYSWAGASTVLTVPSVNGTVSLAVGANREVTLNFIPNNALVSGLVVTSGLSPMPSGWSGPQSFSCPNVNAGCALTLTYAPTVSASGTLVLTYRYLDQLGVSESGTINIPYAATSDNNIVASASPGSAAATVGGGVQSVLITFTTDDGSVASALSVTSPLASLPLGWTSGSNAFGCASVSTGNGCQLAFSYAPLSAGSGTLTLDYSYTDNAGQARTGGINIPYAATTNDTVVGTASPSGQIATTVGASQGVSVTFTTDDGNVASGLAITSDLTTLPSGWSSSASSFSCASVSSGSGCQLALSYAPGAAASGTLTLNLSYTNDAGVAKTGTVSVLYTATAHDNVIGIASPSGPITTPIGGSQGVTLTFTTDDGNAASGFAITSDLTTLPSGWTSGSGSLNCASVSTGSGCQLALSYAPGGAGSGTLILAFSYTDDAGTPKTGSVSVPYAATTHDTVSGTAAPSSSIAVTVGASQAIAINFTTSDGNAASGFAITSNLAALPAGWSTSTNPFSCAVVSTGNGCALPLTYAPAGVASGTLSLNYSYTDDAGTLKTGTVSVAYTATTHDNVIGTASPSGQIVASVGASQGVTVSFTTDDGNTATGLSITTNLTALPAGWTSGAPTFGCPSVSTGNGCELALTYTPSGAASGTLTLNYSYTDDAGTAQTGSLNLPYLATTNDNVVGTASPSGQIAVAVGGSEGVTVSFTSDDGNAASALSITTNLTSLPAGWSSSSNSFSCVSVATGNGCQLALTYTPSAAASGTLTLDYSYTNDAGVSKTGSVSFPYTATTNDHVIGTPSPSGQIAVSVGGSQGASVTFTTDDGNVATGLSVTTNLGALPSGWSSSSNPFSCASVSTGTGCQLGLTYAPTGAASGTLTVNYSYTNDAGIAKTGSFGIPYTGTAIYTVGGSVSGLTGSVSLQDNGGNTYTTSSNGAFTFSVALASGSSYVVTVSSQPSEQSCSVTNGSGTVSANVTNVAVTCTTNTYSIGGTISGLSASGLKLTDNGGDTLTVSSGATSFTFATQLAYGASYAVAVSIQPTGELCSVSNGSGTVTGTVTSVTLSCVIAYTIGGTISGLNVSSVVLANAGTTVTVSAGASSWVFASSFASGSSYSVTVQTQPAGETCQVTSGASGTLSANLSNVTVACAFGLWTWQGGSSGTNAYGVYGTKGTAAAGNVPGARQGAATWVDSHGNLWLFGGFGYGASGSPSSLNDLWEYSSGEWTWVSGGSGTNATGVYGTKGTPASSNVPGARERVASWIDSSNNLWLFGGTGWASGPGNLNDLWEYTPSSGEWTWVSGSNSVSAYGVYGTKGTPSSSNVPGSRFGSSFWIDSHGNLWLFAGNGQNASATGELNDLWEYSSGEWTWVSGSSSINSNGAYGTQGMGSSSNAPGARIGSIGWADSAGNTWLFGGTGHDASGSTGDLNDLWEYSSGEWTWVSGLSSISGNGVYGTEGVAASSNTPGARSYATASIDSAGNLWLFGGSGYGASGSSGDLNDLWKYSSGEWTWVSGSSATNSLGVYGTEGTASLNNVPGARQGGPTSWIDSSGNVWLLGGNGYGASGSSGYLNDLWQFTPAQ